MGCGYDNDYSVFIPLLGRNNGYEMQGRIWIGVASLLVLSMDMQYHLYNLIDKYRKHQNHIKEAKTKQRNHNCTERKWRIELLVDHLLFYYPTLTKISPSLTFSQSESLISERRVNMGCWASSKYFQSYDIHTGQIRNHYKYRYYMDKKIVF